MGLWREKRAGQGNCSSVPVLGIHTWQPPVTYPWSRSKARKLTRSRSNRARPAVEKTVRIVAPSAPSPRILSRSRAQLKPQGTNESLTYSTPLKYPDCWEG